MPREVTALLGVKPTRSCIKGDINNFGQKVIHNIWICDYESKNLRTLNDVDDYIQRCLHHFFSKKNTLKNLSEIKTKMQGDVYLYLAIFWYSDKIPYAAFLLSNKTLSVLSKINADIYVSIYPCVNKKNKRKLK